MRHIVRALSILPAAMLTASVLFATGLSAQVVAVKSSKESGFGFMFRHLETCYVILPSHVAADERRITVLTAAPVANAEARIETPFWEGLDLAIGPLRGTAVEQCTDTIASLGGSARPEVGGKLELVRLRPSGEVERVPMRFATTSFLTLEAEITTDSDELYQGTSGAMLFQDDAPVGMAVVSTSPKRGTFVRIEQISANISLWLNRRSGVFSSEPEAETTDTKGLPFEVVSSLIEPVSPQYSATNLRGPGQYIFKPSRANRITLLVTADGDIALSRVRVQSNPDAGYALPRGLRVEVSTAGPDDVGRDFLKGEMATDGTFDVRRSPSRARWVFVTIDSAWSAGPIAVEEVVLE